MQICPPPYLSSFIKHYLVFEIRTGEKRKFRHFANGLTGLVFVLEKNNLKLSKTKRPLPEAYIFGQTIKNQDFLVDGATKIVIVMFQPTGLYCLSGISGKGLQDNIVDASVIFGEGISRLNEKLRKVPSTLEKIYLLNKYFSKNISGRIYEVSPDLESTIRLIRSSQGCISVRELSFRTNINERRLQRIFSEQIGISPIKFIKNYKLHSFLGSLVRKRSLHSLTELSLSAGYYDQAHLIKEFKKITGITPSAYLRRKSLAVNLFEIV